MRWMLIQRTIFLVAVERSSMVPPLTLSVDMKKGPNLRWSLIQCSGGDEGDRTPDLLTASQALSQLSYAPVRRSTIRELARRCKDNFGKNFRRRGAGAPDRARIARKGPRGAPRGRRPRRRPTCWGPPAASGAARAAAVRRPCALTGPFDRPRGPPATKPAHLLRLGIIPRPRRYGRNENRR